MRRCSPCSPTAKHGRARPWRWRSAPARAPCSAPSISLQRGQGAVDWSRAGTPLDDPAGAGFEGPGWIARAEANLCGPEAEGLPLAVSVIPKAERPLSPAPAWSGGVGPIVPAMAVRHASDDLCIRWWASP